MSDILKLNFNIQLPNYITFMKNIITYSSRIQYL